MKLSFPTEEQIKKIVEKNDKKKSKEKEKRGKATTSKNINSIVDKVNDEEFEFESESVSMGKHYPLSLFIIISK